MWNSILVTGGSGRLGTELKKHLKAHYPTKKELNITKINKTLLCDLIVHMAAYTNVDKAETEKAECFNINVFGTYQLIRHFPDKPIVFLSTEHVNAEGIYFQSKLIGELLVKNLAKNYLIIRTLFKPNPWPFEYAFIDQMTQGDYLDVIAPLIAKAIKGWNGKSKTIYVGTERKSMFELAKKTKPNVKPNSVDDLPLKRPKDYL
ncbi:MAG: sugar nucleotide-binding protein [Candidatus Daviesbacteria bacterium]|nr:sugar nucleotide-binding protein [Candidatus Daviesbacteria bacterium]